MLVSFHKIDQPDLAWVNPEHIDIVTRDLSNPNRTALFIGGSDEAIYVADPVEYVVRIINASFTSKAPSVG